MNKKPVLPSGYFVPRIERMRNGMIEHKNEVSTTNNLYKMFTDRMVTTMNNEGGEARRLRTAFLDFLVHDDSGDGTLAIRCLEKACEKMSLGDDDRHKFMGMLCNALSDSRHPEVQKAINRIKPFGWIKPQAPMRKVA